MFSDTFIRPTRFLAIVLLLTGCAHFNPDFQNSTTNDPYAQAGVAELLAFGANMAGMSEPSRTEVCQSLKNTQNLSPSIGVELHLMVGRLLSEDCGDIPELLENVNTIDPNQISDENLKRLIAFDIQVLSRLDDQSKKLAFAEKQQKVKSASEVKESREPKKNETRLLREKLEAIRSMEKQLDESNGSN